MNTKDERIAELNADKVQLENDACVARGEIDRLTADRDSWFKTARKKHAQLKGKDERIAELERYERFYQHIEAHLTSDQVVVCKICGKSLLEIEQTLKGEVES